MEQISGSNKILQPWPCYWNQRALCQTHCLQPVNLHTIKSWFGRYSAFHSSSGQVKLLSGQFRHLSMCFDWTLRSSIVLNHYAGVSWETLHTSGFDMSVCSFRLFHLSVLWDFHSLTGFSNLNHLYYCILSSLLLWGNVVVDLVCAWKYIYI